jgi:hypothetical protein
MSVPGCFQGNVAAFVTLIAAVLIAISSYFTRVNAVFIEWCFSRSNSGTKVVRRTKISWGLKKMGNVVDKRPMQSHTESSKARTNRKVPVEQWPESLEILRHLASRQKAVSIKELAHDVSAPEISTRNRLARLEALGAVEANRATAILGPGKQVTCAHYVITQYGRDCVVSRGQTTSSVSRLCVNSVFALARAMNLA